MADALFIVITVSDSCYNKIAQDLSGPCLSDILRKTFPSSRIIEEILPDEKSLIENSLCKYSSNPEAHVIFTTGGTGFSPRDVTPEATRTVIHRECPQLILAMALESFKKTPFAALSRAVSGIRNRTLIINLPGSVKAVRECFEAIRTVLPHAIQVIRNDLDLVKNTHQNVQKCDRSIESSSSEQSYVHICPHKTGTGSRDDRNSPFPMITITEALEIIFETVQSNRENVDFLQSIVSPLDIPPFRASIKDGYALKSTGNLGVKKVIGYIAAGDDVSGYSLKNDECFKINTGAALPDDADCVIQIEDTKLVETNPDGTERFVELLVKLKPQLDIRPIGCDLKKGCKLFPTVDVSDVVVKSLLSSIGRNDTLNKPKVAVISTGSELLDPKVGKHEESHSKIYDSNTTMLVELLKYFCFPCTECAVVKDDSISVKSTISEMFKSVDFIICTGGVSMGDKDYIKPALNELGFKIHFGRVNMKPGKPMTFASKNQKYFFGLPGNPVSAFVTFHLFSLPILRWASGWERNKCELATIQVKLENDELQLDPRPEFVRASVISRNGELFAKVTGDQLSSRLQSIVNADVLLHLPGRTYSRKSVKYGECFTASVLRFDFISKYE